MEQDFGVESTVLWNIRGKDHSFFPIFLFSVYVGFQGLEVCTLWISGHMSCIGIGTDTTF